MASPFPYRQREGLPHVIGDTPEYRTSGEESRHVHQHDVDRRADTGAFNSIYHATKWALEGWSENMAFELNQFGIGMKTVSPGGMKTDFFTRLFDSGKHEAYDGRSLAVASGWQGAGTANGHI
jgi:NAD(P)-dependent dehydrogenase (short-subunit alcohol dehydrogenase family)